MQRLDILEQLLEESDFVQKHKAKGVEEGLKKGVEKGRKEGIKKGEALAFQSSLVTIVNTRFPSLTDLARRRTVQQDRPEILQAAIEQILIVSQEEEARSILNTL